MTLAIGKKILGDNHLDVPTCLNNLVMSLWKVEDDATKDLMIAYSQGLKVGKGRGDALLEIQRDRLKEGKYQHPYYWASFIFSGINNSLTKSMIISYNL